MKIIDITQEVFGCEVYPGDSKPLKKRTVSMDDGNIYNLTEFSMCAHNGTHIDAPFHFFKDGKTAEQIDLCDVYGKCFVAEASGEINGEDAHKIINKAKALDAEAYKRILIKGDAFIDLEAAKVFVKEKVRLIGSETQSVGPVSEPAAVHRELLGAETVLLEGIRLFAVSEGVYTLFAAPLKLGGSDGAPCRAVLTTA